MRSSLERHLARWERNELPVADLERHHPGRAAALVAVYERLTNLGTAAVPDPQLGWDRLRGRLPDRRLVLPEWRRGPMIRRLVARPLAAAAAVILLSGAAGYAAAPRAVNHRLTTVWRSVESLFLEPIGSGRPERSPAPQRGGGPGLVPSVPDGEDGDDDRDDDGEGRDEIDDDGDDPEDGEDDEGEESSEGSDDGTDDDSGDDSGDDGSSGEESDGGDAEEDEEDLGDD